MSSTSRILVIDDSPTVRRIIEHGLCAEGYDVTSADAGATGIEQARVCSPDLILVDVQLPDMPGIQVVKELNLDVMLRDIPVVMLLTRTNQLEPAALTGLGVVGTLQKPFKPNVLLDEIAAVIRTYGPAANEQTIPSLSAYIPAQSPPTADGADLFMPAREASSSQDFGSLLSFDPSSESPRAPHFIQHRKRPPAQTAKLPGSDEKQETPLEEIQRIFTEALFARGIDDADELTQNLFQNVQEQFSATIADEFLKRKIGIEVLRGPLPSLHGDLAVIPLPEVLQLLKLQGQTGVLEVSVNDARFEVHFRDGQLVGLRGRNVLAVNRLGQYFLLLGSVDKATLSQELLSFDGAQPLGIFLLERKIIQESDLRGAVKAQAEDLMYEMLRMKRGYFGLRRGEVLVDKLPFSGFSVDELLLDGLRRIDEQSTIEECVGSSASIIEALKGISTSELDSSELEVLTHLLGEGPLSVGQLAKRVGLHDEEVMKISYRLITGRRARVQKLASEESQT
ncbi:MAG: response regulator [Deltaproteobacteria bacterium]|nr:response regulator [Deltaproteobacteria bacterium]